jgi:hypothetical protein
MPLSRLSDHAADQLYRMSAAKRGSTAFAAMRSYCTLLPMTVL